MILSSLLNNAHIWWMSRKQNGELNLTAGNDEKQKQIKWSVSLDIAKAFNRV